jgi:hypothetical protein
MAYKATVHRRFLAAIKFANQNSKELGSIGKQDGLPRNEIDDHELKLKTFMGLATGPLPDELMVAFNLAGMDQTDPIHWFQLLGLFAWAHFGPQRKRGATIKWDAERLCQLDNDYREIKQRSPNLSDNAIFGQLAKKSHYRIKRGELSKSRIRKLLKQAHNPERNGFLKYLYFAPRSS